MPCSLLTYIQTHIQNDYWGLPFRVSVVFFLQPIIKDRDLRALFLCNIWCWQTHNQLPELTISLSIQVTKKYKRQKVGITLIKLFIFYVHFCLMIQLVVYISFKCVFLNTFDVAQCFKGDKCCFHSLFIYKLAVVLWTYIAIIPFIHSCIAFMKSSY